MNDTPRTPAEFNKQLSEAYSVVQDGLTSLASRRPGGDDDTFDYWPNALEAFQNLYRIAYLEEGRAEIQEYLIQHIEEACGTDIHDRYLAVLKNMPEYLRPTIVMPADSPGDPYFATEVAPKYTALDLEVRYE